MAETPWIDLAVVDGTTLARTVAVKTTDAEGNETTQDLTGCVLLFRVFEIEQEPVVTKALAIPSPMSGEGFLLVLPADYAPLVSGTVYMHDIRLTDSAGGVSAIMQGGFSRITD